MVASKLGRPAGSFDGSAFRAVCPSREVRKWGAMSARDETEAGVLAGITRDLVRLHHDYYGKGPTKARSYMVNDTVISILEGGFTTVEATLIAEGKSEAVHSMRRSFQMAMEERFRVLEVGKIREGLAKL